jgi:hypothetical protein
MLNEAKLHLPTLTDLNAAVEQARARRDAVLKERKEQAERAKIEKVRLLLDDVYNVVCNKITPAMMAAAEKGESTFYLTFGDWSPDVYMDFDDFEETNGIIVEVFMNHLQKRLDAYLSLSVSVTEWHNDRCHWGLRFDF